MYTCIVPSASDVIWSPTTSLVDDTTCDKAGRRLFIEKEEQKMLKHYPLKNVVFYTQIPYLKKQVMSREFEFLLADLGMHFASSNYLKEMMGKGS